MKELLLQFNVITVNMYWQWKQLISRLIWISALLTSINLLICSLYQFKWSFHRKFNHCWAQLLRHWIERQQWQSTCWIYHLITMKTLMFELMSTSFILNTHLLCIWSWQKCCWMRFIKQWRWRSILCSWVIIWTFSAMSQLIYKRKES